MKALGALAIVTGGVVIGFAVYALAWHDRSAQTEQPAPGQRVLTLAQGDVVLVPAAGARCAVSGEGGFPNFFCMHTGRTGYHVVLWKDSADLYDLSRRGEPLAPTYTVPGLLDRSCGRLSAGIGWRLRATPNVRCPSARHLMSVYFRRRADRRISETVLGYVCTKRDLRNGEHVRCVRAAQAVSAKSFGY